AILMEAGARHVSQRDRGTSVPGTPMSVIDVQLHAAKSVMLLEFDLVGVLSYEQARESSKGSPPLLAAKRDAEKYAGPHSWGLRSLDPTLPFDSDCKMIARPPAIIDSSMNCSRCSGVPLISCMIATGRTNVLIIKIRC